MGYHKLQPKETESLRAASRQDHKRIIANISHDSRLNISTKSARDTTLHATMLHPLTTYGRMPTTTQSNQNKITINYNSQPMDEVTVDKNTNYTIPKPLMAIRNAETQASVVLKNFHTNIIEQLYDQTIHPIDR